VKYFCDLEMKKIFLASRKLLSNDKILPGTLLGGPKAAVFGPAYEKTSRKLVATPKNNYVKAVCGMFAQYIFL
jgi:hypothetical protein